MPWIISDGRPVYIQLIEEIKLRIITGMYVCGDRLPSVRDLAQEAKVNPNTMQKALQELERTGLIYTNRTSGKFITDDSELIKSVRRDLAATKIDDFIISMKKLGYSMSEISDEITKFNKGGEFSE